MPYIRKEYRDKLDPHLSKLEDELKPMMRGNQGKGNLTYALYHLGLTAIQQKGVRYGTVSDILACFRDAEMELRRRVLDPYEDSIRDINGDIGERS